MDTMQILLLLSIMLTLASSDKGIGCWDKYCGDPPHRIPCETDKMTCVQDPITFKPRCEQPRFMLKKPDPAMYCQNTFLQECGCMHGPRGNWEARCDCKVPVRAIILFVMLGVFLLAVFGCVYCGAKWHLRKRQQMILHMERLYREEEAREQQTGDSNSLSNGQPADHRKMLATAAVKVPRKSHAPNPMAGHHARHNPRPLTSNTRTISTVAVPKLGTTIDPNMCHGYRRKGARSPSPAVRKVQSTDSDRTIPSYSGNNSAA